MIRAATPADAAAVLRVHRESRAVAYAHMGPPEAARGGSTLQTWRMALQRARTWVALVGEEVVGFVAVEDDGRLSGLYVLPGFEGRGIGSALHDLAVAEGASSLWVYEANAGARAFYERRGWIAEPETAYADPKWAIVEPALRYRLP